MSQLSRQELRRLIQDIARDAGKQYGVTLTDAGLQFLSSPSPRDPASRPFLEVDIFEIKEEMLRDAIFEVVALAKEPITPRFGASKLRLSHTYYHDLRSPRMKVINSKMLRNAKKRSNCHYLWFC